MTNGGEGGAAEGRAELWIGGLRAGDVVFARSRTRSLRDRVVRRLNLAGQRLLDLARRGRVPAGPGGRGWPHVMLGLDGGLVIHADGKSVAIEVISDALHHASDEASEFAVMRRRDLAPETAQTIVRAAARFYSRRYRFVSYFGPADPGEDAAAAEKRDSTQFCSRLVAHAYRRAGLPLGDLPDQRVLPLDLHRLCSGPDWEDVTESLLAKPVAPEMDAALGTFAVEGVGERTYSEWAADGDRLVRELAALEAERRRIEHDSMGRMLQVEALFAQLAGAELDLAKGLRLAPAEIDAAASDKVDPPARIAAVLSHLPELLALALAESSDGFVADDLFNTAQDGEEGLGLYAGWPAPEAIREMQRARVHVSVFAALLFAETGLLVIVAHDTEHEKFAAFRAVSEETMERFRAALVRPEDLSPWRDETGLFRWVAAESDRETSLVRLRHILAGLELVALAERG